MLNFALSAQGGEGPECFFPFLSPSLLQLSAENTEDAEQLALEALISPWEVEPWFSSL